MTAAEARTKVHALYQLGVELSNVVEKGYLIVRSIRDPELKSEYADELDPLIWELQALNDDLVRALDQYFEAEKDEDLPVDFQMRSLYRQLKA